MSKFWDHYEAAKPRVANAVDDVRHKVVEEGWFGKTQGRAVSGEIGKPSMDVEPEKKPEQPANVTHNHNTLYAQVWGREPEAKDIYGNAPASEAPRIEPAKAPERSPGLEPDL
jgi:hypothetical protein